MPLLSLPHSCDENACSSDEECGAKAAMVKAAIDHLDCFASIPNEMKAKVSHYPAQSRKIFLNKRCLTANQALTSDLAVIDKHVHGIALFAADHLLSEYQKEICRHPTK